MASIIERIERNLMISTINNVQSGLMQLCKLKLENGQDIEAIMLPNMELQLQPQNIPEQWKSLKGKWANQNTQGVTAHILLGANHATKFQQAVRNTSGTLFQVNQARLMKSEITGKYIMFGCSNSPPSFEPSNLTKSRNFKSLRLRCKASPTLVSAITRNIGNIHSPIIQGEKEDLKKKHGGNPYKLVLPNLKESKEESTTSKTLPSTVPKSHQPKENKLQQPTDLPKVHNPQDTRNQHKKFYKEDGMEINNAKTAKERNKQCPKPIPNQ